MKGAALRKQRKTLGMTQLELGKALGLTGNTVARYERDEVRIPEPVARLLMLLRPKGKR